MSEDNRYEGLDTGRRSYSADDLGYPAKAGGWLRHPVIAVLVLLVTAGIFALVISASFSGDDDVLPVVRADSSPVKQVPDDRGGMDIPNAESSVFAQIEDSENGTRIEDLFASSAVNKRVQGDGSVQPSDQALTEASEDLIAEAEVIVRSMQDKAVKAADEGKVVVDKPDTMYAAGASPETKAFVKSVLEEKAPETVKPVIAATTPTPNAPATIARAEPAAGSAGTHYVQMASIQDKARASSEWAKLLVKYPSLNGAGYRVQEKVIADKGVFYRIQAGPFSKDLAASKCEAVKAASGGCFLVAR